MKTEAKNTENMETAKNQALSTLAKVARETDLRIEAMEEKLRSLQGRRVWVVKVNAVYFVGDGGNNTVALSNGVLGAHLFVSKPDADHCARSSTYTNSVTGDKFKAEAVILADVAFTDEIAKAREANADIKKALTENGIEL